MKMTRQEKRQTQRDAEKAYQELKDMSPLAKELFRNMVRNETVGICHCLYGITLNAVNGFGATRINEVIRNVMEQFDSIRNNAIDPKEITDWCINKGINFTKYEV
jgi:hypothetical protein